MPNWEYAAGKVWPELAQAARQKKTVTYGTIALLIGTIPLSVGRALEPIQTYCLENRLPPLTAIVVNQSTGIPGDGFIAWDADDIESAWEKVFSFNWDTITNPYGGFGPEDSSKSFANCLIERPTPENAEEVYARVKVRGIAQSIFRFTLMGAYGSRCAICGLSFEDALDAAHIKPWQKCEHNERLNPRNGLLLCASHHRLFDSGLISLSESLRIIYYDPAMEDDDYSEPDKALTVNIHGHPTFLPEADNLKPALNFLRAHHEVMRNRVGDYFYNRLPIS